MGLRPLPKLFRFSLIVLLLICAEASYSQLSELRNRDIKDRTEKSRLAALLPDQVPVSGNGWRKDNLDEFYFIDLDDDRDRDVIFTGWTGANTDGVLILLTQGNVRRVALRELGSIKNAAFSGNRLSQFTVEDPGCCAEFIVFTKVYSVKAQKDSLKFDIIERTALIDQTELPESWLSITFEFEVMNDKYFMRVSPKVDTVDIEYFGEQANGNIIAEFRKGAKGKALAEKMDDTGRVWWFVEIGPDHKPVTTVFYDIENTKVRGWMSSRYLKRL